MRKILSIVLCALFLFNISGYYIVFKWMQYSAREEMSLMKRQLTEEEMEIVIVPDSEVTSHSTVFRFVDEKEFIYHGKLYDIVKKIKDGNNTIFYCINDEKEEHLMSGFNEHLERNSEQGTPAKDKSIQLIKNIIKEALPENPGFISCSANQNTLSFKYISLTEEQYIPVLSPPPKF